MFKRVFVAGVSALLLAGTSTLAMAQAGDPAVAERMKGHITYLASDDLMGRDTGSAGHIAAVEYVERHYAELGLTPLGNAERTSWRQPITFANISTTGGEMKVGDQTFRQGEHFAAYSTVLGQQSFDAEMVFVGHGVVAPTEGIDDYAGLDVRGKVVVVLYDMPEGLPSELSAHLQSSKATTAAERGAIGVLTLLPAQARPAPWSYLMTFLGEPQMKWTDAQGRPQSDARGLQFEGYLSTPMTDALFAGAPMSGQEVQTKGATERVQGFALPGRMSGSITTSAEMIESPNVVGVLEGSDPVLKNEYVVVMGHLDHVGVDEEEEGDDKIFNGAMDNASGIATMIEVARDLSADRPKRSVIFLAVTAEEKGLLGSSYYAANPTVPLENIVAAVNLDMPILTYAFEDVVAFGAEHSTLGVVTAEAAAAVGIAVTPDPTPEEAFFVRSDHYEFVKAGVPSIYRDTGPAGPGAEASAIFLENDYHKVSDEIDLPFDWDAAARFQAVNTSIARTIADGPRPLWYSDSPFAVEGQPTAQRPAN
jgi:Zn-dependent M28 family amino/carboxypeptidase